MTHPEDFIAETCPEALLQDVCKALRADCDAMRKESERYRKLRAAGWIDDSIMTANDIIEHDPSTLDAAVDRLPAVG